MITAQTIRLATHDILGSIRMWRVWYLIGTIDVRQRYRRSVLGPFWANATTESARAVITAKTIERISPLPSVDRLPSR